MNMVRVNYHLTRLQVEKLKEISLDTGLSVAELIRRCVDGHIQTWTIQESKRDKESDRR